MLGLPALKEPEIVRLKSAQVPTKCTGVPADILNPSNLWSNKEEFGKTLAHLADLYQVSYLLYAHSSWHSLGF
jgi:phosphoenolpyruvate carboxykinase (ATP)